MTNILSITFRNCLGALLLLLLLATNASAQITWDFETGNLIGWMNRNRFRSSTDVPG